MNMGYMQSQIDREIELRRQEVDRTHRMIMSGVYFLVFLFVAGLFILGAYLADAQEEETSNDRYSYMVTDKVLPQDELTIDNLLDRKRRVEFLLTKYIVLYEECRIINR